MRHSTLNAGTSIPLCQHSGCSERVCSSSPSIYNERTAELCWNSGVLCYSGTVMLKAMHRETPWQLGEHRSSINNLEERPRITSDETAPLLSTWFVIRSLLVCSFSLLRAPPRIHDTLTGRKWKLKNNERTVTSTSINKDFPMESKQSWPRFVTNGKVTFLLENVIK